MQHITGEVGQSIRHDYGEFIKIGCVRLRKELIVSYSWTPISDMPDTPFGIRVFVSGGWIVCPVGTREETEKDLLRLDWFFKKDEK